MLGTDFPCPRTGSMCQNTSCPATACVYDLDDAVWPDVQPDPMDLVNTPAPYLAGEA